MSSYNPYQLLKEKEFRSFIIGRFLFIMGLRMTGTVVAWWVYQLTNSPLALGLVGLSEVLPALSLSLYAGHYIDRNENRRLLLRCLIIYIICAIGLFLLSENNFVATTKPWTIACFIFVIIGITGAVRAFSGPVFSSIISKIVSKEQLAAAASISTATWLTASIFGHALAGFAIAWMGVHFTYLLILTFMCGGFYSLYLLQSKPVNSISKSNTWQSVKEGIHYVFNTKEILGALILDLFAVLFGGAVAMIPIFAKEILHTNSIGFGWLNAASDIGSIIMVTTLTLKPLKKKQGKILLYAVGLFGICIIAFALSNFFWLSFIALLISGAVDGVSMIIRSVILQIKTPDHIRGRVMSVNSMFINSSNELGQFESGVAAKIFGLVPSVIIGGCMTIGIVIVTWFKAPSLRKMEY